MQVDQPHHAPHGFGEFVRQYAMIVLSILTALGLEHVAVDLQDRQAAQVSQARIEAELARNLADLRQSEQVNLQTLARVRAVMRALIPLIKAGKPIDAATEALLQAAFANFAVSTASWQHNAWETAIADQSAGHLPGKLLSRYSEIYSTAADETSTWQLLLSGEWLTKAAELMVDYQVGSLDAAATAKVLLRFLVACQQIEKGEERLGGLIGGTTAPGGG